MGRLTGEFNNVILLTGTRQAGKTSLLRTLVPELKAQALILSGVISPAVFNFGEKIAIDLQDVTSGETRRMAEKRKEESSGILTDRWVFDSEVLAWGDSILAAVSTCDVLIIDELGPLEFERGQGLQHGLTAVENGEYTLAIVVIRPELIEKVLLRWPGASVIDAAEGPEQAYGDIMRRIRSCFN
jgi:nucleoside-triphosphatase THEP1